MIKGIYLDPRSWEADCIAHPNWNTTRFGIDLQLYGEDNQAKNTPLSKDCSFVVATEVWTPQMQNILERFKKNGMKVFLLPRETVLAEGYRNVMFKNTLCNNNGKYFFNPDVILSPGKHYSSFWKEKTKVVNIGHPKFDLYACNGWHEDLESIRKNFNIDDNKKMVLFSSYWSKHYQNNGDQIYYKDISQDHLETMMALEKAADDSSLQVVVKMHPTTQKLFSKGKEDLDPIMKKHNTTDGKIRIIGDNRFSSRNARNLLFAADLVIGFRSTMLIEAAIIGRPIINVMLSNAQSLSGLPDIVNRIFSVYTKENLYECILHSDYKQYGVLDSDVVNDYVHIVDGNFCKRMCAEIKSNL